jgi:hypothetical protein
MGLGIRRPLAGYNVLLAIAYWVTININAKCGPSAMTVATGSEGDET